MKVAYVIHDNKYGESERKFLHYIVDSMKYSRVAVLLFQPNAITADLERLKIPYKQVRGIAGATSYMRHNKFDIVNILESSKIASNFANFVKKTKIIETHFAKSRELFQSDRAVILETPFFQHKNATVAGMRLSDSLCYRPSSPNEISFVARDVESFNLLIPAKLADCLDIHKDNQKIVIYSHDTAMVASKMRALTSSTRIVCRPLDSLTSMGVLIDCKRDGKLSIDVWESATSIPTIVPNATESKLFCDYFGAQQYEPSGSMELLRMYCLVKKENVDNSSGVFAFGDFLKNFYSQLLEIKVAPSAPPPVTIEASAIQRPLCPFLAPNERTFIIIPYSIYGGAEVYLSNYLEGQDPSSVTLVFLANNIQLQRKWQSTYECVNSDLSKLATLLVRRNAGRVIFYNSRSVYHVLSKIKQSYKFHLIEIVHSYMHWQDSMHGTIRNAVDQTFVVAHAIAKQWRIDKYEVLPPTIDERRFKIPKRKDPNKIVIGTVARLSMEKNLFRVLDIASRLTEPYHFVIVGQDGGVKKDLLKQIKAKGLTDRVTIKDHTAEVEKEYATFDLFLLTSSIEGTPLTILEALAADLPVVAPDVGAIKEMVAGKPSYVYPPTAKNEEIANKIKALIKRETIQPEPVKVPYVDSRNSLRHEISKNPLVSFYIPAYNCAAYIGRAIDSILSQTYKKVEVCICDDGSTDDTLKYLEQNYAGRGNVTWISQKNKGIGAASNAALALCKGEIVAQLDADDWIDPSAIEKILPIYWNNPDVGAVYTDYNIVDAAGNFVELGWSYPDFNMKTMLRRMIVHPLRTFKRSVWFQTEGFDEELENAVDYDMQMKLAEKTRFYHLRERLYYYRQLPTSTSHTKRAKQADNTRRVIEKALIRQNLPLRVVQAGPGSFAMDLVRTNKDIVDSKKLSIRIIAASDGAPHETWWGDYWAKKFLEEALKKKGYEIIPNLHYNKPNNRPPADVDLFCHAASEYPYLTAPIKLAWVFTRHFKALEQAEYFKGFDHVFSLSKKGVADWEALNIPVSFLPAGSTKNPSSREFPRIYDVLFVGNPRGERPKLLDALIAAGIKNIAIYGAGWDKPEHRRFRKMFKGKYFPNEKMSDLYSQARIVLNVHEWQMLESEGVSIKALDIMSTASFLLTDNPGIKDFARSAIVFTDAEDLVAKAKYYLSNEEERNQIARDCRDQSARFTFDRVAEEVDRVAKIMRRKHEDSLL